MKKSNLIAICFVAISTSGCGAMVAKATISSYPTSIYNVFNITEGDLNNYYAQLEKSKDRVVNDEKGSYFYKKEKDAVFSRFALLNEDGVFLKSSLSSSVGLMEPIYSYDNSAKLQVDWKETKRQYKFFTEQVGLKLLPLKSTRRYHDLVVQLGENSSTTPYSIVSSAFSGEMGLYNPDFYSKILVGVSKRAAYLISNGSTDTYHLSTIGIDAPKKGIGRYRSATKKINNFYNLSINFVPISYFKNLKKGGAFRFYSGCQVNSKAAELHAITYVNESSNIPYFSGIASAIKDKNESQIALAENQFYQALKKVKSNRLLIERACKVGFKAMSLSGIIDSKKLR